MDKRSLVVWIGCFLICFAYPVKAQVKWIKELKYGKNLTIVVYGTSLTAGPPAKVWVDGLRDTLNAQFSGKVNMINSGQEAMHSDWGVSHIQERVLGFEPDVVFIEFAINDAFLPYTISPEVSALNLKYMIARIRAKNPKAEIVLQIMNVPVDQHVEQRPQIAQYYDQYKRIGKHCGLTVIDHREYWSTMQDEATYRKWVPDGIHPSAAASKELILPYLLQNLMK